MGSRRARSLGLAAPPAGRNREIDPADEIILDAHDDAPKAEVSGRMLEGSGMPDHACDTRFEVVLPLRQPDFDAELPR